MYPTSLRYLIGVGCEGVTLHNTGSLRQWNLKPNWCSLCKEPYNAWDQHRGKRDHVCLEVFFDAICCESRRWNVNTMWSNAFLKKFPIDGIFSANDSADKLRREKLIAALFYLKRKGVIFASLPECAGIPEGMFLRKYLSARVFVARGSFYMHKMIAHAIAHIFPRAEAKHHTAFSQQIASTYNMETVWDLCNFSSLLSIPSGFLPCFHEKGSLVKSILGEISEYIDRVPDDPPPASFTGTEHILADFVARSIMAEAIHLRMLEYVARVEAVWREYGLEIIKDRKAFHLLPAIQVSNLEYLLSKETAR
ncbi:hypothetical protein XU18_0268 [Perkinsela sp. CCAP 1560/4]|nr:hypothetical protein XU18_0268 [Perkinsela sp. CCAP 1560/4]|eukprot:KNH09583.1 hypothetical protein XU18_0268 [Perkinsela sp. CCAP 1560/4]